MEYSSSTNKEFSENFGIKEEALNTGFVEKIKGEVVEAEEFEKVLEPLKQGKQAEVNDWVVVSFRGNSNGKNFIDQIQEQKQDGTFTTKFVPGHMLKISAYFIQIKLENY